MTIKKQIAFKCKQERCSGSKFYISKDNEYIVCTTCGTCHIEDSGNLHIAKPQPKIKPLDPSKFNARDTLTHELTPNLVEIFGANNIMKCNLYLENPEFTLMLRRKPKDVYIDKSKIEAFADEFDGNYQKLDYTYLDNGTLKVNLPEGEKLNEHKKILVVFK
jgi:hypothetical protein